MQGKLQKAEDVEIPEAVRIAAIKGRLTFFIGNGVSRLYNLPSWDDLANTMLRKLVQYGKINYNKFDLLRKYPTKTKISIADHYFKENLETGEIQSLTYESILTESASQESIAYSLLAKIGCRFLTTNYDSLLSDALRSNSLEGRPIKTSTLEESMAPKPEVSHESKGNVNVYNSLDEFSRMGLLNKNILVHLHGSISNEKTIVASTVDYLKHYGESERIKKLKLLLKDQTVVFIGYGLEELELLDLIVRASRNDNEEDEKKFFLLLPMLTHEFEIYDLLKLYYENQLGIELLPYSRDELDYHSVEEIIENWSRILPDFVNEPSHEDKVDLLNSLLSEYKAVER